VKEDEESTAEDLSWAGFGNEIWKLQWEWRRIEEKTRGGSGKEKGLWWRRAYEMVRT